MWVYYPSLLLFITTLHTHHLIHNALHVCLKKAIIVTSKKCGMSDREIAAKENFDPSTVSHIVRRCGKKHNFNSIAPKTGCPCNMDERDAWKAHWMINLGVAVTNHGIGPQQTDTKPPCYKVNKRRTHPFSFPTDLGPDRSQEIHAVTLLFKSQSVGTSSTKHGKVVPQQDDQVIKLLRKSGTTFKRINQHMLHHSRDITQCGLSHSPRHWVIRFNSSEY